jgi:hypothetical protein
MGDRWLSWGRWVAKLEMGGYLGGAPTCYGSSLGSNLDVSQMRNISKGVAKHTLASPPPTKIDKKKIFCNSPTRLDLISCMSVFNNQSVPAVFTA